MAEQLMMYKLMILYMLKKVKFPLSNAQLADFFIGHEYITYFLLQQALSELIDAHLIKVESTMNSTRYEITSEGEESLSFFGKKLASPLVRDMDEYLAENKVRLRDEVSTVSDYYKSTEQDYVVHCEIREGRTVLFEMNMAVPDREQAEYMCARWKGKSQKIYSAAMQELMRD